MSRDSEKDLRKEIEMKLAAGKVPEELIPQLTLNLMNAVKSGISHTNISKCLEELVKDTKLRDAVLKEPVDCWPCKWG